MKTYNHTGLCILIAALSIAINSRAADTNMQKMEIAKDKAVEKIKKTYRSAKDETCALLNSKADCAGKRLKHKVQNFSDEMGTKSTELKSKIE